MSIVSSDPATLDEKTARNLVCDLCRQFFQSGWVTGTGGSISIKVKDSILMTPSGVQKEMIKPEDLFTVGLDGKVIHQPPHLSKLSDCAPLFLHAYNQRNAGAVLHSHAINLNIITQLCDGKNEFKISHQEMIKGIEGYGYYDELTIPIIENTAHEHELADCLGETIAKYPKSCAVLVRRHGMYVWGKSWQQAKRHAECLHYLFDIAIKMHEMGLFTYTNLNSPRKRKFPADGDFSTSTYSFDHLLLDIEGTTTPITFVKDILFPYSMKEVDSFLDRKWSNPDVQEIVKGLIEAYNTTAKERNDELLSEGSKGLKTSISSYFKQLVTLDKKVAPLKKLQGLIWEEGYHNGLLKGAFFEDIVRNLERFTNQGVKVSIYSSGSKYAQQLIYGFSVFGDLRKYIHCYFDTKIGLKGESASYKEILLTLGVTDASKVMFVTDVLAEANASNAAGMQATLSLRPGNAPIHEPHSFPTITSFDQL